MVKLWFLCSLFVVFALDFVSKLAVYLYKPSFALLPFFSLSYVENRGAGFGVLQGFGWLFVVVSAVVLVFIAVHYPKISGRYSEVAFGLFSGGLLGNLADRVFRGFVVDFLDFSIGAYHWPAFNIADTALCIGVFLLVVRKGSA